jgi:hypothetical protein
VRGHGDVGWRHACLMKWNAEGVFPGDSQSCFNSSVWIGIAAAKTTLKKGDTLIANLSSRTLI